MTAAANLTLLFTEYSLAGRFAAARAAGFGAVELLFPYEMPAKDLRRLLQYADQELVLFNTPAGNWAAGERGFAAVPGAEAKFRAGFERAMRWADVLRPRFIHVMAGIADGPAAWATFIRNLRWATARAGGRQLTIEPINPYDIPGYFLNDFDSAAAILDKVGAANLHLQFDAYHAHRITGDVTGCWARHGWRAAHVQVAGSPGRHEPVGGDIDYPAFFAQLAGDGYAGHVSGEYVPVGQTEDGLGWIAQVALHEKRLPRGAPGVF